MAQPAGRELFGASWKGEGPLPLTGVAPQSQPLQGMLLRPSTDICLKELTRDVRGFFNSLLGCATNAEIENTVTAGCRLRAGLSVSASGVRVRANALRA